MTFQWPSPPAPALALQQCSIPTCSCLAYVHALSSYPQIHHWFTGDESLPLPWFIADLFAVNTMFSSLLFVAGLLAANPVSSGRFTKFPHRPAMGQTMNVVLAFTGNSNIDHHPYQKTVGIILQLLLWGLSPPDLFPVDQFISPLDPSLLGISPLDTVLLKIIASSHHTLDLDLQRLPTSVTFPPIPPHLSSEVSTRTKAIPHQPVGRTDRRA